MASSNGSQGEEPKAALTHDELSQVIRTLYQTVKEQKRVIVDLIDLLVDKNNLPRSAYSLVNSLSPVGVSAGVAPSASASYNNVPAVISHAACSSSAVALAAHVSAAVKGKAKAPRDDAPLMGESSKRLRVGSPSPSRSS